MKYKVNQLEYAPEEEAEFFDSLDDAIKYHLEETAYLDTTVGIWNGEDLLAIGYLSEVFYKR